MILFFCVRFLLQFCVENMMELFLGFGVFAKRKISKGTLLCQYRGEMVTEVEFDKDVDMGKRKDDNFVYTLMLKGVCYWYVTYSLKHLKV